MLKNKKWISLLLSAVMLVTMSCTSVLAGENIKNTNAVAESNVTPRVAQYVWVDTDVLNVRSGPGTKYSIVGQVYQDQRLWITFAQYDEYGNDWYKCIAAGGWVSANYVRYEE